MPVIAASLVTNDFGLFWSAVTCTVAGVLCAWGAARGVIQHRIPRIAVAVSTLVIAATYWCDIFESVGVGVTVDWRRGAGFILWPALAWTAWSGMKYSRRVVAATEQLMGSTDAD